jgi:signal transduction histidine kinase/CheY-like chemotaxis protein
MRVVFVSPNEADSVLASGFLAGHGFATETCDSVAALSARIGPGVGCVVLVEEALAQSDMQPFHDALNAQPTWSDMPLLLVASQGSSLAALVESTFPHSGNVTVLQRPLHPVSLVSAVSVALRSRQRQYQVRELLALRDNAVKQRDEFLAMLAHELRNPLAPIRNAVFLMGTLDNVDPLFVRCRDMIDKQTRHVTRLVDDLLDASRLELGKVELRAQVMDLNDAVASAVEACAPVTGAHRHTVQVRTAPAPLPVRADPVRLEQAVGNLIVNAAKFTPEGGTIVVEAAREGGSGVISVSDNGVGIRPDMLESIFELFAQSEVTLARTEGGLGIGLTLVKRLIEMHGGSVHAFSNGPGTGARFEARLPLVAAAVAPQAHANVAPERAPSRRVLIAEDGTDTRESMGLLVESWKHQALFAADGPEAVRVALDTHPDVALIDIGLPGHDGYAVAREIRAEGSDWSRRVRLVALTGYGQASDRARALTAGFDLHLLKPVDPNELKSVLAGM